MHPPPSPILIDITITSPSLSFLHDISFASLLLHDTSPSLAINSIFSNTCTRRPSHLPLLASSSSYGLENKRGVLRSKKGDRHTKGDTRLTPTAASFFLGQQSGTPSDCFAEASFLLVELLLAAPSPQTILYFQLKKKRGRGERADPARPSFLGLPTPQVRWSRLQPSRMRDQPSAEKPRAGWDPSPLPLLKVPSLTDTSKHRMSLVSKP
ncbi:hypothetical protein CDL15_Pgr012035 [Punica granatum]|uniref:Uncharacterized protein n=1 Tax=Punica granatum TaxID=22663 RepID=A0A218VTV7_PUNGR|nr:hypothetical protein CDL15_Pgr012035 [Punica granatum]PKI33418.1 hypothetical protein CRG98_046181 [Punica granatum]